MIFAEPNNGYFFQHLWRDRTLTRPPCRVTKLQELGEPGNPVLTPIINVAGLSFDMF